MQHFTDTYVSVQGGILYGTCSGALGNVIFYLIKVGIFTMHILLQIN